MSQPPYAAPDASQPGPGRSRSRLPWIVAGVVVVLLLVTAGIVLAVTAGGDPDSVRDVADEAVEAAENLDVDAGIDLLCDAPSSQEREQLEELIDSAREESGEQDPDADYDVSDVQGDEDGSFVVRITSDDPDLEAHSATFQVEVRSKDGRSCIGSFEAVD